MIKIAADSPAESFPEGDQVKGTGVGQSTDEDSEFRQRRSHPPVHQEFARLVGADA
jgi:hypothetical protein